MVIVTPDCYETIRKTIGYLQAQTARDRLEVVIIAPSAATLDLEERELGGFLQFRVVEVGPIRSLAWANAIGVREACAPLVAFVEEHSYPDSGWAAALIEAHRGSWAAVGPSMRNANPGSLVSKADFLIAYGHWLDTAPAGTIDHLPGHNSSYKRRILLDYSHRELQALLEAESVLHWDLVNRGYQLYLEPAAKTSHVNFGVLRAWITVLFFSGRVFAATRARHWSLLRRLVYAGGAPFIPTVRFWRIMRQLRRSRLHHRVGPGLLASLMLGLIVSEMGETVGYALRAGDAAQKLSHFEFHRIDHIPEQRRQTQWH